MMKTGMIEPWGRFPVCEGVEHFPEPQRAGRFPAGRFLVRGFARSYGDACIQKQVVNSRRWNRLLSFEPRRGVLSCEAGISLAEILEWAVPRGWFLPVTPGTKFVSLGGAIASDVHGKNHHVAGSFSRHVSEIELILPSGSTVHVSRKKRPDLFGATCGGMGLTGVIRSATLQLVPIETSYFMQTVHRAENLAALMALVEEHGREPFTVAWLDMNAGGKSMGRGHLITGRWASAEDFQKSGLPEKKRLSIHRPPLLRLPFDLPPFIAAFAARFGFKCASWVYDRLPRRYGAPALVHYDPFFYPLDILDDWNLAYGKKGFLQWQCVIPTEHSAEGVRLILDTCRNNGLHSFVTVLKLFGKGNGFPLSFPMEGYILCLDFARTEGLPAVLEKLDAIVVERGGRIYLAKDARMSRRTLGKGYPGLPAFLKLKKAIDPEGRLASVQAQRLGLVPGRTR
jgi:FAD/FMN-containing dehydrogenase